jgi:DNA excision repair protein ERCC-3
VLSTGADAWDTSDNFVKTHNGQRMKKPSAKQPALKNSGNGAGPAQRFTAPLEHLSGGMTMAYKEQNRSVK